MSEGLRLVAAAIIAGSAGSLIQMDRGMFVEGEQAVYDFVRQHYRQYRSLPETATIQTELGVRLPRAEEPLSFYVDKVYERHQYNQIRERYETFREGMARRDMEAVSSSVRDMGSVIRASHRRGEEILDIRQAFELADSRLVATRGLGGITGIEVGWPTYDRTTGGYQRGDLISIVGRPSLGKTFVMLRQAWYAHTQGHSVLFVTTEMSAEQIARRHVSLAMGIDPTALRNNTISTYTHRRIRSFYRDMADVEGFKIFSVGMKAGVASVEALVHEYEPDFVAIDGMYLLRPSSTLRTSNKTERISAVLDEVKGMALEVNRPFLVSTQFNRAAGKGGSDGSLENIGFTDSIGTHSSVVVAVQEGPTDNHRHSRWLSFLKGREGESGRVAINFKFAPVDMSELDWDEANPGQNQTAGAGRAAGANVDWMG